MQPSDVAYDVLRHHDRSLHLRGMATEKGFSFHFFYCGAGVTQSVNIVTI